MYKTNEKCIGCMACVRVAEKHFALDENGKAQVILQPLVADEIDEVEHAMAICPTEAILYESEIFKIVSKKDTTDNDIADEVILGHHNVRETFEKYPELKAIMVGLSPKFKSLFNPVMWNTMARFATFETASNVTNISLCEILHKLNYAIGLEQALIKAFPSCVSELKTGAVALKNQTITEIAVALNRAIDEPTVLDVRGSTTDPFDKIIKLAYETKDGDSFTLVQSFKPDPMINMLSTMDFESVILQEIAGDVHIQFTKKHTTGHEIHMDNTMDSTNKPALTIQSATPVGYPIIMRLLQSKRLKEAIQIKELKVWEETEKHLAWIVNERADISFSATITATKFKDAKVKMPVVFVWDNFVLLTRKTDAKKLADLKGETIRLPLFEDAPPAKITKYLLGTEGLVMSDFNFEYGNPFGRPRELMVAFAAGKVDHVLLREPEASFAIAGARESGIEFNEINYGTLFNIANPGFGQFPNAGVIVKESLYIKYPEAMKVFEEELESAISWVNEHPREAAELSFDMMRSTVDNVEAFINRVQFKYQSGDALVSKMKAFYSVLSENGILPFSVDQQLIEMFRP